MLSLKESDIKDVDKAFYLHNFEHNKKFDYYLVKWRYKLIFNDYEYCPCVTSKLSDIKAMIPWKSWLEEVICGVKNKGCTFNHIAETHILTIA